MHMHTYVHIPYSSRTDACTCTHVRAHTPPPTIGLQVSYLKEHKLTVLRKLSELKGKMGDVDTAVTANAHKLQRIVHTTELAIADKRRDLVQLEGEVKDVDHRFATLKEDVRQLDSNPLLASAGLGLNTCVSWSLFPPISRLQLTDPEAPCNVSATRSTRLRHLTRVPGSLPPPRQRRPLCVFWVFSWYGGPAK